MILKMVLGLMQSILSFILGLLPLPDVPAWLVELTETILGYMKTGMGIVLFFVPQVVVQNENIRKLQSLPIAKQTKAGVLKKCGIHTQHPTDNVRRLPIF